MAHANFRLAENPDQTQRDFVSKLKETLSGTGLVLEIFDPDETRHGHSELFIFFDQERFAEHTRRGAGRRHKLLKDYRRVTVGEVRAMLETQTAEEVAAELGVSRSTLFRRLKGKEDGARF